MSDTKENILMTALHLFAKDGYEAVSVSKIAGELGMTKGALYKHYKNKRDIFDSIFKRICELDVERAENAGISEGAYENVSMESVVEYTKIQFFYWSEDEVACDFRRLLTLEQYRDPEMHTLYQKVLAGGPIDYLEGLFKEMMNQGTLNPCNPRQLAVKFFAPFLLLLSMSDAATSKKEKKEIAKLFATHVESVTKNRRIL